MRSSLQEYLDMFVNPYPTEISVSKIGAKTLMGVFAGGRAVCTSIAFGVQDGNVIIADFPVPATLTGGYMSMSAGSDLLWKKHPAFDEERITLPQAIEHVRNFIQKCIEGNGKVPDCSEFGGHLHIGTVDKSGFRWAITPANQS